MYNQMTDEEIAAMNHNLRLAQNESEASRDLRDAERRFNVASREAMRREDFSIMGMPAASLRRAKARHATAARQLARGVA